MNALLTIGHSTLSAEAFLRALKENSVELLVDVRRYPGSRRHPHFSQEKLFTLLREAGVETAWREALGGRRTARTDSLNVGWREPAFRGYADYMQTDAFRAEIDWIMQRMCKQHVAVMCAEAVPWRCHRSLIADAVLARGGEVRDIFVKADGASEQKQHRLTPFARVLDGSVTYPPETQDLFR